MLNIMDMIGGHFADGLIDNIRAKKKCFVNGDNLNIKTSVKDMRMDHHNKMHNWFMTMVVFERVDFSNLDNSAPLGNLATFANANYLLSEAEVESLKGNLKVIVCRAFLSVIKLPMFKFLERNCPAHIQHPFSHEMSQQSEIFPQPIHFKDEKKLADMVDILCDIENRLEEVFAEVSGGEARDGVPADFECPFSGDQLTRVRATSARNLRAGCHTKKDRLEHTKPDVIELWHLKQSFLMVSTIFSQTSSGSTSMFLGFNSKVGLNNNSCVGNYIALWARLVEMWLLISQD